MANFDPPGEPPTLSQIQNIGVLLYALQASITRLYLDVFLREIDVRSPLFDNASLNIRHALHSLTSLEELCSMHDLFDWEHPPVWNTLRRLAMASTPSSRRILDGTKLDGISKLKALELCIVHTAAGAGPEACASMLRNPTLLADGWAQRDLELVLTVKQGEDRVFRTLRDRLPTAQETRKPGRGFVTVMETDTVWRAKIPPGEAWHGLRVWFARAVLEGSIWDRKREAWYDYFPHLIINWVREGRYEMSSKQPQHVNQPLS